MGEEGAGVLGLLGSAASAYGSYVQGKAEKTAYDIQADEIEQAGALKIEEMTAEGEKLTSTQRAIYAKAGVRESGSVLTVMLDSATNVEFDKLTEEWNTRVKADALRYSGTMAALQGLSKAGGSLLQGGMSIMKYGNTVPTVSDSRGSAGGYNAYLSNQASQGE